MEKYQLESIDTLDYSDSKRYFLLMLGGVGLGHSEEVRGKCMELCKEAVSRVTDGDDIKVAAEGVVIQTALQNIPNIIRELAKENIGIYGVVPIKDPEL